MDLVRREVNGGSKFTVGNRSLHRGKLGQIGEIPGKAKLLQPGKGGRYGIQGRIETKVAESSSGNVVDDLE